MRLGQRCQRSVGVVVHTRDGATQQVGTWRGLPGRTTHLEAATSADRVDIDAVEVVVTGTDRPVLELDVAPS